MFSKINSFKKWVTHYLNKSVEKFMCISNNLNNDLIVSNG